MKYKLHIIKTTNKKPPKKFDAIKTMREIRDKLSLEIMNISYEEEREYLDKLLAEGKSQTL